MIFDMPGRIQILERLVNSIVVCFWAVAFSSMAFGDTPGEAGQYVIQLGDYTVSRIQIRTELYRLQPLQVYAETGDKGSSWRLKAGFFSSAAEARQIANAMRVNYPDLMVQQVAMHENQAIDDALQLPPVAAASERENVVVALGGRRQVDLQLKRAASLYSQKDFSQASTIYLLLSKVPSQEQAAWALELYGVCLEKQNDREGAMRIYQQWLALYADNAGQTRVKQRLVALDTAPSEPKALRKKAKKGTNDTAIYGSTSLMYRGLRRKVEQQSAETSISSLQANLDLYLRSRAGNYLVRSRISGGYLADYSYRSESDTRINNLYLDVTHEPSRARLALGRQRSNDNGVYGYLDGLIASYPITDKFSVSVSAGSLANSSRDFSNSGRRVIGLGSEIRFDNPAWRLNLYALEQTYEGFTERRALGGEVSYFNDFSHYLFIVDYDIKFNEPNNLMFNGSWNLGAATNIAVSLGYQRSPFLSASNALIGEFDIDLDQLVEGLDDGTDVYDAALDKTAISRYASVLVNQEITETLSFIGEIYRYEMSDLPVYDPLFDAPDSDANTTFGLQLVIADAIMANDYLSGGIRYTTGDSADATSLFVDERISFNQNLNLTLRMLATQRSLKDFDQQAYTLRPVVSLDWYFTPSFLLEFELGYEWLLQDFQSESYQVQQGFLITGLRKRF
jgi:hypothetical protein